MNHPSICLLALLTLGPASRQEPTPAQTGAIPRYEFVTGVAGRAHYIYRCDRFTGEVWSCAAGSDLAWAKVGEPQPPAGTFVGDTKAADAALRSADPDSAVALSILARSSEAVLAIAADGTATMSISGTGANGAKFDWKADGLWNRNHRGVSLLLADNSGTVFRGLAEGKAVKLTPQGSKIPWVFNAQR